MVYSRYSCLTTHRTLEGCFAHQIIYLPEDSNTTPHKDKTVVPIQSVNLTWAYLKVSKLKVRFDFLDFEIN